MDAAELEELLTVFEKSLSQIKWRLKSSSKSRLQTDILALCSRMRPCIMVDYGGKMPELGNRLCEFLKCCKKETSIFELLQVAVIDDMVYLIHVRSLTDFVESSLRMETEMLYVDLETDPPKMLTSADKSTAITQLLSAQKFFSSVFKADGNAAFESSEIVDLSLCLQESHVTIPTLNGWLLGYPVIYLFRKDHIEDAVYNLSTKSLNIYQIFVTRLTMRLFWNKWHRVKASSKGEQKEELTSFTVPYDLSLEGNDEAWAKSFLAQMQQRWENCKHVWGSLSMEVHGCYPQAIAL